MAKTNKFEHFKKNGVDAYSNIRSLYGKEGEKLLEDVINAFNKAWDVTKDELSDVINHPKMQKVNEKCKEAKESIKDNKFSFGDLINSLGDVVSEVINNIDKDVEKPECDCEHKCSDKTKCKCKAEHSCADNPKCGCTCEHSCDKNKCNNNCKGDCKKVYKKPKCVGGNLKDYFNNCFNHPINNELDSTINGDSASTHIVRRKHQDYINDMTNIIHTVDSPLPDALHRLYGQAKTSYKHQKCQKHYVVSDIEKKFITDILNILFKALDTQFSVGNSNDVNADEYDDYFLPVFDVTDIETNEDVIPTSIHDGYDYWFEGLNHEHELPGISVLVKFDNYPTEIKQRLMYNSDNGALLKLLAKFSAYDADNITFITHNDSEGIIKFYMSIPEKYDNKKAKEAVQEF